ncbi:MAG: hypothetical protein ACSHYA_01370 [Opitutaceae bacterium]
MNSEQVKLDLECIAQKRPLAPGDTLGDVLSRLDAIAAEKGLPERLQHYLSKRSYLKALEWMENPETPHRV